jgi:4-hydroxybenzoate polyprenyltransferase
VSKVKVSAGDTVSVWVKQLRLVQWAKNLLLFVPVLASFNFLQLPQDSFIDLLVAFASFSLIASAVYVVNDYFDLANDRAHPIKRYRPMASKALSVRAALSVACSSLAIGLILGYTVGLPFFITLLTYLILTSAYSLWLKKISLVDCITLAGLYTLRLVAGSLASGVQLSFWLLAFAVFFFLSLAWVKRYAELEAVQKTGKTSAPGRGYSVSDLPLIQLFGVASAFLAVLIFALYLDSSAIRLQYAVPEIGWLAIPFMLYLIGRMWFKAHRGEMNQDPLIFLIKDAPSLVTIALVGLALAAAHVGFQA